MLLKSTSQFYPEVSLPFYISIIEIKTVIDLANLMYYFPIKYMVCSI